MFDFFAEYSNFFHQSNRMIFFVFDFVVEKWKNEKVKMLFNHVSFQIFTEENNREWVEFLMKSKFFEMKNHKKYEEILYEEKLNNIFYVI